MNITTELAAYSAREERLNILSHKIAAVLSAIALIALIIRAAPLEGWLPLISAAIYGSCMTCLYIASSCYHSAVKPNRRLRLKVFDHAAIYLLIAGTYTPFTLVTLAGPVGWTLFAVSWSMAAVGITLKLFYTGRFKILSTAMYVFMGWLIIFAYTPLIESFAADGMFWLLTGGIIYTLGAVLYSIKKIPYNHAIFHIATVIASGCHFIAIYCYVLV
ncbi:hypothetical protein SIN8267_00111 [Sinobacterium norvegicum]|uniref:Hemolysin III n=1 Tax=Sinobacterium norvegicum TaxID=1641715 RepID=A0ABN8ECC9_9GAMM|nr:hemolysin III family protein [Sinobacterium norvegicum]CAH0990028.1 hypothetical protein SIN8267_00111 [Sinobacterium norvegicum]